MRQTIPLHGQTDHRANGPDPIPVLVHREVIAHNKAGTAGDDKRRFTVTPDLAGARLRSAHASHSEAGSSATTIQIHNIDTTDDLMADLITIPSGATDSWGAVAQPVVDDSGDPPVNLVSRGDRLRIDIVSWGTGALGLVVHLEFGPAIVRMTPAGP